jgi:hypothetical protein
MKCPAFFLVFVISACTVYPADCGASQDTAIDKRVAVLIERMLNADTEQKAFFDLETLGCAAVPATIQRMDDRRTLPDSRISFAISHQMHLKMSATTDLCKLLMLSLRS